MTDNKIEAKLDVFRKQQENITKVGFSIQHSDIPDHLAAAALGKRYYIILIDADHYDENDGKMQTHEKEQSANNAHCSYSKNSSNSTGHKSSPVVKEKLTTDGKLRIRAVMLCKEEAFQAFVYENSGDDGLWYKPSEKMATQNLYDACNIKSRSELATNPEAQEKFRELDQQFKDWQRYGDNLNREYGE